MNKPSLWTLALLILAAGLLVRAEPAAAAENDWTGAWIGGNAGAGMSTGHIDDPDCWYCTNSVFQERLLQVGVEGGYQKQFGTAVVGLGAELNLGSQHHTGIHNNGGTGGQPQVLSKVNWTAALMGRAGVAVQNSLVYLTAGPALARVEDSVADSNPGSSYHPVFSGWQPGFKAGAGVEFLVAPHVSVGARYTVLTLADRVAYGMPNSGARTIFAGSQTLAAVGAAWHF